MRKKFSYFQMLDVVERKTMRKSELQKVIDTAELDAPVTVRVHKTSPCVDIMTAFIDEDGFVQIILPEKSNIGKKTKTLTTPAVARMIGVDLKTVHNWVAKGKIKHFRTPGRHLRFDFCDVMEFIENNTKNQEEK